MNTEELLERLETIEQRLLTISDDYSLPDFAADQETFKGEFDLLNNRLDTLTYMATYAMIGQIKEYRIRITRLLNYISFRRKYREYSWEDLVQVIDRDNYINDFQTDLKSISGTNSKKTFIDNLTKIKTDWSLFFPNTSFSTFETKL